MMAGDQCTRIFATLAVVCAAAAAIASAQTSSSSVVWSLTASDVVLTPPVVSGSLILFGTGVGDGQLRAVGLNDGVQRWSYFPGGASEINSAPAPVPSTDLVVVGSANRRLTAVNRTNGAVVWVVLPASNVNCDALAVGDRIFFGSDDRTVQALVATTGAVVWSFTANAEIRGSPALVQSINAIVVGTLNGTVFALASATGALVWQYNASSAVQTPMFVSSAATGGRVIFGSDAGDIYCLTASTGLLQWRYASGTTQVRATVAEFGGNALLGLRDGALHAIRIATGTLAWKYQAVSTTGAVGSAVVERGFAFIVASDGRARAVNASTGTLDDPRYSWSVGSPTGNNPSPRPVAVTASLVIAASGATLTAVTDPTIVTTTTTTTLGPTTFASALSTTTTGAATSTTASSAVAAARRPMSTLVSNPGPITSSAAPLAAPLLALGAVLFF